MRTRRPQITQVINLIQPMMVTSAAVPGASVSRVCDNAPRNESLRQTQERFNFTHPLEIAKVAQALIERWERGNSPAAQPAAPV